MTREEADKEAMKLDCIDLYYAVKRACLHDVDREWRAALVRAVRREKRQTARVMAAVTVKHSQGNMRAGISDNLHIG